MPLQLQGIDEFEPPVVDMLIDFVYSYSKDVLKDAQAYGEAVGKPTASVSLQDVELAIRSRSFAQMLSLEVRRVCHVWLEVLRSCSTALVIASELGSDCIMCVCAELERPAIACQNTLAHATCLCPPCPCCRPAEQGTLQECQEEERKMLHAPYIAAGNRTRVR
jgi:hypothetical protein